MINGGYGLRGDALYLLKVKTRRSVGDARVEELKFSKKSRKELRDTAGGGGGDQPTDAEDIFIVLHFDRLLIYFLSVTLIYIFHIAR